MSITTMTVTIQKRDVAPFRDIRADLRTRIERLEAMSSRAQTKFIESQERAATEHRKVMDGFKNALANYRKLLELEESSPKPMCLTLPTKLGRCLMRSNSDARGADVIG